MDVKFGTSGLRGPASELIAGAAFAYVRAFASFLLGCSIAKKGDVVYIGRDKRPSSAAISNICDNAVELAGFVCKDCGLVPTPALFWHAATRGAASIMITGSHIAADRNGLKFYLPFGEISKSDEEEISRRVVWHEKFLPAKTATSAANCNRAAIRGWLRRYGDLFAPDFFAGMRIGVYEHSSVGTNPIGRLLAGFGAEVRYFGKSANFLAVDTEAMADEFARLFRRKAAELSLDAIVSADADGDRPVLADEAGGLIGGDLLGLVCAMWVGADIAVTPVSSNSAIRSNAHIEVRRTRIGSPYVIEAMQEAIRKEYRCIVGFEANGGFLLGSAVTLDGNTIAALPTRDSVLPLLSVLHYLKCHGIKASSLPGVLGLRALATGRQPDFPPERGTALVRRLLEDLPFRSQFLKKIGVASAVDATDGARFEIGESRIVHFRQSGNAPEMRCYAEAETGTQACRLRDLGLAALTRFKMPS